VRIPDFPVTNHRTTRDRLPQTQDSPKEAAESTKYDDGAPGQGSKAELDHEQVDEPTKSHLHDEEPRPTETKQVRLSIFVDIRKPLMPTTIHVGECARAGRGK
jgi:hypothetical protein